MPQVERMGKKLESVTLSRSDNYSNNRDRRHSSLSANWSRHPDCHATSFYHLWYYVHLVDLQVSTDVS